MKRMPSAVSRLRTAVVDSSTSCGLRVDGLVRDAGAHQVEHVGEQDHQADQQDEDDDRVGHLVPHPLDQVERRSRTVFSCGYQ